MSTAPSLAAPPTDGLLSTRPTSPAMLLALLGHVAMRRLRDVHAAQDLTPRQFHLLGLLRQHGPLGQRELGTMIGTDPSTLVTMLNPLEANHLVSRERDEQDRRRHLVTLTAAGEARLASAAQAQREAEDELFASLDTTQRAQLLALLTTLQDGLAGVYGSPCTAVAAPTCLPISDHRSLP